MSNFFYQGKEYKVESRNASVGDLVRIEQDTFKPDTHGFPKGYVGQVTDIKVKPQGDFLVEMQESIWGEKLPDERVRIDDMANATHEDYVVLTEVSQDDDLTEFEKTHIPESWIGKKARILNDNACDTPYNKGDIVTIVKSDHPLAIMAGIPAMLKREGDDRTYSLPQAEIELTAQQEGDSPKEVPQQVENNANPPFGARVEVLVDDDSIFGMAYRKGQQGEVIQPDSFAKTLGIEYLVLLDDGSKKAIPPEEIEVVDGSKTQEVQEGDTIELLEDDFMWECYYKGDRKVVESKYDELGFYDDEDDFRELNGIDYKIVK